MLLENADFDEFDLSRYDIRDLNKATQTHVFDDNISSNSSSVASNQSMKTPSEIQRNEQQHQRQVFQQGKVWMM